MEGTKMACKGLGNTLSCAGSLLGLTLVPSDESNDESEHLSCLLRPSANMIKTRDRIEQNTRDKPKSQLKTKEIACKTRGRVKQTLGGESAIFSLRKRFSQKKTKFFFFL